MFSNDRNIETIGQLVEVVKHYVGLQSKHMKLDIIDKVVRVLTVLTMTFVLMLLLLLAIEARQDRVLNEIAAQEHKDR